MTVNEALKTIQEMADTIHGEFCNGHFETCAGCKRYRTAMEVVTERISTLEDVAHEYKALRDRPEPFGLQYIRKEDE